MFGIVFKVFVSEVFVFVILVLEKFSFRFHLLFTLLLFVMPFHIAHFGRHPWKRPLLHVQVSEISIKMAKILRNSSFRGLRFRGLHFRGLRSSFSGS